jgi:hypothetical protein
MIRRISLRATCFLALCVAACSDTISVDEHTFQETVWVLDHTRLDNVVERPEPEETYQIVFTRNHTIQGMAGCASCIGVYDRRDDQLILSVTCDASVCGASPPSIQAFAAYTSGIFLHEIRRNRLSLTKFGDTGDGGRSLVFLAQP